MGKASRHCCASEKRGCFSSWPGPGKSGPAFTGKDQGSALPLPALLLWLVELKGLTKNSGYTKPRVALPAQINSFFSFPGVWDIDTARLCLSSLEVSFCPFFPPLSKVSASNSGWLWTHNLSALAFQVLESQEYTTMPGCCIAILGWLINSIQIN